MITVFKHTFLRSRGAILGWGVTMALMGMIFAPFYDTISENAQQFEQLIDIYPQELMAFFGASGTFNFTTPEGFLAVEYFSYMPLVVGVFAILAGSALLAADEERGILDLIAAHPVSRTSLFWGRLLALLLSLVLIMGFGYVGLMLGTTYSAMELDALLLVYPFASLLGLLIFFAGLALFMSMLLPSRGSAAMVAGVVLVASFFLNGLANLNDSLDNLKPLLPTRYYQSQDWVSGFRWDWFAGLAGIGLLLAVLAWWLFLRRDIRVGGEGSWKLPRWRRSPAKA